MNRVPASLRDVAFASRRCAIVAGLTLCTLAAPALSEASPITWLYTGSVTSTYTNTLVPLGSPATILLAVDPQHNVNAGAPGAPSNAGAYSSPLPWISPGVDIQLTVSSN